VQKQNLGAQIYLIFIGLAVAVMGGIFVSLLWKGYLKAKETRSWNEVPALVQELSVKERYGSASIPREYSVDLTYVYTLGDQVYIGKRLRLRENPWYKERAKVDAQMSQWRVGQEVIAYVDPENPDVAVVEHEPKAPGYSIWFPSLFVIGGLGIIMRAFWMILSNRRESVA